MSGYQSYGHTIRLWTAEEWQPDSLVALDAPAGAKSLVTMGVHHDDVDQQWSTRINHHVDRHHPDLLHTGGGIESDPYTPPGIRVLAIRVPATLPSLYAASFRITFAPAR